MQPTRQFLASAMSLLPLRFRFEWTPLSLFLGWNVKCLRQNSNLIEFGCPERYRDLHLHCEWAERSIRLRVFKVLSKRVKLKQIPKKAVKGFGPDDRITLHKLTRKPFNSQIFTKLYKIKINMEKLFKYKSSVEAKTTSKRIKPKAPRKARRMQ